jgi:hypothetical protein
MTRRLAATAGRTRSKAPSRSDGVEQRGSQIRVLVSHSKQKAATASSREADNDEESESGTRRPQQAIGCNDEVERGRRGQIIDAALPALR